MLLIVPEASLYAPESPDYAVRMISVFMMYTATKKKRKNKLVADKLESIRGLFWYIILKTVNLHKVTQEAAA